jgi:hypothetical protein
MGGISFLPSEVWLLVRTVSGPQLNTLARSYNCELPQCNAWSDGSQSIVHAGSDMPYNLCCVVISVACETGVTISLRRNAGSSSWGFTCYPVIVNKWHQKQCLVFACVHEDLKESKLASCYPPPLFDASTRTWLFNLLEVPKTQCEALSPITERSLLY